MQLFLENNAIYLVLIIGLIIWFGLAGLLFRIDGRLKRLELIAEDIKEDVADE